MLLGKLGWSAVAKVLEIKLKGVWVYRQTQLGIRWYAIYHM